MTSGVDDRVTSILRDGANWRYSYGEPTAGSSSLTVTDPAGRVRRYTSDLSVGLPTRVEDEFGRATSYSYDDAGRVLTMTAPGGQVTAHAYDPRGNVLRTTVTPTEGGAGVTTSATYPTTCTIFATCNLPLTTTDARGNSTSYDYAVHGGVTSAITRDAKGVILRMERTRYAQVSGVWLPVKSWSCRTTAECEDTADAVQIVTAYDVVQANSQDDRRGRWIGGVDHCDLKHLPGRCAGSRRPIAGDRRYHPIILRPRQAVTCSPFSGR